MTITDANTSRQNEENTEQIMENTAIDTQNITNIDNTAQLDSCLLYTSDAADDLRV